MAEYYEHYHEILEEDEAFFEELYANLPKREQNRPRSKQWFQVSYIFVLSKKKKHLEITYLAF